MYGEAVLRLQRDPDVLNDIGDKRGAENVRLATSRNAAQGNGGDSRRG